MIEILKTRWLLSLLKSKTQRRVVLDNSIPEEQIEIVANA